MKYKIYYKNSESVRIQDSSPIEFATTSERAFAGLIVTSLNSTCPPYTLSFYYEEEVEPLDYIESINVVNEKEFGPLQSCCDMYQYFCRCEELNKLQ